ncbi:MAG: NifU family protein [Phycisphaerales bacterium JB060]
MTKEHRLPQADQTPAPAARDGDALSGTAEQRVQQVIEQIRPSIQADGGDVEFVEFTGEGVVRIRLHGACVGCPSSSLTLQVGLERNLREHVPEVRSVQAVD